ncbi:energy transducer TonB [Acidicapsa ligni]|uniref:energy transducer TonB n=1 Tax=Acidicapsa ligni TaxID=542300 RepID=UPI0021E0EA77|nr:energy transducer TonB [Acidicapsa ligni]
MANDLLNPPEAETGANPGANAAFRSGSQTSAASSETGHELDSFLGKAFEEKSIWADLFENVHDVFFPTKLPPLELTSKPIPVADPMAVKRSPLSIAISAGINIGVLLLVLFAFRHQIAKVIPPSLKMSNVDIAPWKPLTPKAGNIGGGGGGGSHDILSASKGHLPKIEPKPLLQPQVLQVEKPKIALDAAIDVQKNIKLPDNPNLPNIGVLNSSNNVVLSNGQGSGGGIGNGKNGGLGNGNGNGYGPGTGGNVGGGIRQVGNGVTAPKVIYSVEAEFSDEARRAKYEGEVTISLIVDAQGNPQNVRVAHALGMGLDEKAIEAVKQYRFKPSIDQKTGKPVPVQINFLVNFRLY